MLQMYNAWAVVSQSTNAPHHMFQEHPLLDDLPTCARYFETVSRAECWQKLSPSDGTAAAGLVLMGGQTQIKDMCFFNSATT